MTYRFPNKAMAESEKACLSQAQLRGLLFRNFSAYFTGRRGRDSQRLSLHLSEVIQAPVKLHFVEVSGNLEGDVGGGTLCIVFFTIWPLSNSYTLFSEAKVSQWRPNENYWCFLYIVWCFNSSSDWLHSNSAHSGVSREKKETLKKCFSCIRLFPVSGPDSWMNGFVFLLSSMDGIGSRVTYWILNEITEKKSPNFTLMSTNIGASPSFLFFLFFLQQGFRLHLSKSLGFWVNGFLS